MTRATVGGLPQFLRYLGTFPAPKDMLEALHAGPLSPYGAKVIMLWQVRDDRLVALASVGHTRAEVDRYATLPLSLGLRVTEAVRTAHVIVDADVSTSTLAARQMLDDDLRDAILSRSNAASVLRVPLLHGGASVGALGIVVDRPWPDDVESGVLLDTVALALGLWVTNPRVGVSGSAHRQLVRDWSLSFTDRQREILRLVEQGQSNPAIAAHLNVSASSVKQDLQRCMRALRSDDRMAAAARARELGLL
jgi:DNA-binding CsgD family transcriptional regulator